MMPVLRSHAVGPLKSIRIVADKSYYVTLTMKSAALQRNTSASSVHRQYRVAASLPECERTSCSLGRSDALSDRGDVQVLFDPDTDRGSDGASATRRSPDVGEWAGDVASPELVFTPARRPATFGVPRNELRCAAS